MARAAPWVAACTCALTLAWVARLHAQPEPATAPEPEPAPVAAPEPEPAPAPQPEPEPASKRRIPEISVRIDPFNWLLHGQLAFELEVAVWKFLSAELDMRFVVGDEPPVVHYRSRPDSLRLRSNGAGPLAGFAIGAAAWFGGKPFQGYVLRAYFQNTGLAYESVDSDERMLDRVEQTERRLGVTFGSHSRFGHFTIGGGLGFEYELNSQSRCFLGTSYNDPSTSGCPNDRVQLIALDPADGDTADLNGRMHPIYFVMRLSVGAVF